MERNGTAKKRNGTERTKKGNGTETERFFLRLLYTHLGMKELDSVHDLLITGDLSLEGRDDHWFFMSPELVLAEDVATVLLGETTPLNDCHLWREGGREREREGGRVRGKEGGREGGREEEEEGGREGGREREERGERGRQKHEGKGQATNH